MVLSCSLYRLPVLLLDCLPTYLPACLPICLSIYLPIYLAVWLPSWLPTGCLSNLLACLPNNLLTHLSGYTCLSAGMLAYLHDDCLPTHLPACRPACQFAYLSPACMPVCFPVCSSMYCSELPSRNFFISPSLIYPLFISLLSQCHHPRHSTLHTLSSQSSPCILPLPLILLSSSPPCLSLSSWVTFCGSRVEASLIFGSNFQCTLLNLAAWFCASWVFIAWIFQGASLFILLFSWVVFVFMWREWGKK